VSVLANVTGSTRGIIWGSDVYTDDSDVATAAVHAGVLQADETGTVRITVLPGQSSYSAAVRNNVSSHPYQQWGAVFTSLGLARLSPRSSTWANTEVRSDVNWWPK
jgi:hypothetical protein